MNTTIVKGAVKVGTGKVIKKYASLTGNKKLYVEGLAEELLGRSQRQLGRLKDSSDDLATAISRKISHAKSSAKTTAKMLMKKAKKANASAMDVAEALLSKAKKMNISYATIASVVAILLPFFL